MPESPFPAFDNATEIAGSAEQEFGKYLQDFPGQEYRNWGQAFEAIGRIISEQPTAYNADGAADFATDLVD
jgi:hypothetical protein